MYVPVSIVLVPRNHISRQMSLRTLCSDLDNENMNIKMTPNLPLYTRSLRTSCPPVTVSIYKSIKVDQSVTMTGGQLDVDHDLSSVESKNPIPYFGHGSSNKIKIIPGI